ncbi:protein FAM124A-like isoform X2 [Liolophura sinensis]
MNSSRSDTESESTSLSGSDTESVMLCDPNRLTLHIEAHPHESSAMWDIYQPIFNWIDPDAQLLRITERTHPVENAKGGMAGNASMHDSQRPEVPSIAVLAFLQEEGLFGCDRIQSAKQYFEKTPWKFHYSDKVSKSGINPYPYNSQDYYVTSTDLPLWAMRQVHQGKEHFRFVLFTSYESWEDMVDFYKLMSGASPDVLRSHFCLFTMHTNPHYDVQFALKRLPKDVKPKILDSSSLQFRVGDIGHLVPLFPNVCRPLSDTRWETTDHDGNRIVLETTGLVSQSAIASSSRLSQPLMGFYV